LDAPTASSQDASQTAREEASVVPDGKLRPIVMTPGYQDNAHKVDWLASSLRRRGLRTLVISPQPTDATVGIEVLAEKLAQAVDEALGPTAPFDLFGFSMGGLIHRYYVQNLGDVTRVRRMMTVATPHRGSWSPTLLPPLPALRQMSMNSEFLEALNADISALQQLDFLALWTPFDLSVVPSSSAFLPELPHRRVLSPFHATLLHDPTVMHIIGEWFLAETTPPPES
jgi:triacylglycerol lipase